MALTDTTCRTSTCPAEKTRIRLSDGGGLNLEVAPNASRRWFWKYYFEGKEKRLALGHYTEAGSSKVRVSLSRLQPSSASRARRRDTHQLCAAARTAGTASRWSSFPDSAAHLACQGRRCSAMERQIGGPDEIANLRPLQKGENRSSGATVKAIEVRFQRKPTNVHVARTKRGSALYLLIRSVRG